MNTTTIGIIILQAVLLVALGLAVRGLDKLNKDLQEEVDDLRAKLISEIEDHTKRINEVGDLAAELGLLKCELAKFKDGK